MNKRHANNANNIDNAEAKTMINKYFVLYVGTQSDDDVVSQKNDGILPILILTKGADKWLQQSYDF